MVNATTTLENLERAARGKEAADRQPSAAGARGLHRALRRVDHVLHDRQAEARPARGTGAVAAKEALEQAGEVLLADADSVVRGHEGRPAVLVADRQGQARARARVADRVLREVVGDHANHARAEWKLHVLVPLD